MSDPTTTSTVPSNTLGLTLLRLMWVATTTITPDSGVTDEEKRVYREDNALKFLQRRIRHADPGTPHTYLATVLSRPNWTGGQEFDRDTLKAVEQMSRAGYTHEPGSGQSSELTGKDVRGMSSITPFPVPSKEQLAAKEDLPTDTILREVFAKVIADDEISLESIRGLIAASSSEEIGDADDDHTADATAPVSFTVDLATEEGVDYDNMVTAVTYVFSICAQIADSDSDYTDESSDADVDSQGDASDGSGPDVGED